MLKGWSALLLAGLLEIVWAVGLKYSHSLTRPWPTAIMLIAIALSFWLLAQSLKCVPFGTAYAVWTGIGAAGGMILGIVAFGESADFLPVTCVIFIIAGTLGLRFISVH